MGEVKSKFRVNGFIDFFQLESEGRQVDMQKISTFHHSWKCQRAKQKKRLDIASAQSLQCWNFIWKLVCVYLSEAGTLGILIVAISATINMNMENPPPTAVEQTLFILGGVNLDVVNTWRQIVGLTFNVDLVMSYVLIIKALIPLQHCCLNFSHRLLTSLSTTHPVQRHTPLTGWQSSEHYINFAQKQTAVIVAPSSRLPTSHEQVT